MLINQRFEGKISDVDWLELGPFASLGGLTAPESARRFRARSLVRDQVRVQAKESPTKAWIFLLNQVTGMYWN